MKRIRTKIFFIFTLYKSLSFLYETNLPSPFYAPFSGLARAQWEQTNELLPVITETSFASKGNLLFVATDNSPYWPAQNTTFGNIFRTQKKGANWEMASSGLPLSGSFFVSSTVVQDQYVFAGTTGGIWRSSDNGDSWIQVDSGLLGDTVVVMMGATGDLLFAVTTTSLYKSDDNGSTWTLIVSNLSNS
jgi:photosystem II stability/assembly factor-like uncharacterized protein